MPSAVTAPDSSRIGQLATRFQSALATSRTALSDHAALLPAGRLARIDALVADFEKRRVRIAVYGEVKAGKSTLVNALAGSTLSPSAFGPLTSVPIRITYGEGTRWQIGERQFESAAALADAMSGGLGDDDEVSVSTELDLLRLGGQIDIVDTPGVGSDDGFDAISAKTLRSLDAVVLVVRYPALFTRFTRHLMHSLESDIGKLFVVWNLDAACHDLPESERAQQVENLRRNVAGANDLFTVDARRAFEAARKGDEGGLAASGLAAFVDGLRAFATSEQRTGIALREAAKRAEKWLRQADEALQRRRSVLQDSLAETDRLLAKIDSDARLEVESLNAAHAHYTNRVGEIAATDAAEAASAAKTLRAQLHAARRRWFRKGDGTALAEAIATATAAYADTVDAALSKTTNALHEAAHEFGTVITVAPRERIVPSTDAISSDERMERANQGRLQRTRRWLWKGWYLPGFARVSQTAIDAEMAARTEWLDAAQRAAAGAAKATFDAKLNDIERRAASAAEHCRHDHHLDAERAELERIERDSPTISDARSAITELAAEVRKAEDG